ncbi:MAG: Stage sporulation protein [Myxococcaceae bacterium]|nr:Stage sporulation protein [Myxococcaceae bacterium]
MMLPVLLLALSSAPLEVRVLERDRLTEVMLEADRFSCDGKKLANRAIEVRPKDRRLRAGDQACEVLTAEGDIRVLSGALKRRYYARLSLSNEAEVLRFINTIDVEDYLPSVVEAEAGGSPPAALEAQAIVSRTFAVASRGRHSASGYDLCDLSHCQVFRGHDDESAAARKAVKQSAGQVLLVGGVVLKPAFFHSSCGGGTSKAIDVFSEEGAGGGVNDTGKDGPLCKDAEGFAWEWSIERIELAAALGANPQGDLSAFEILRRDGSGRVLQLKSFGKRYSGVEFASKLGRAFGWQTFRSLRVTMEQVEGLIRFKGQGLGHGVGLCQQGAKALAGKGADSRAILARYFPDCQVRGF